MIRGVQNIPSLLPRNLPRYLERTIIYIIFTKNGEAVCPKLIYRL